MVEIYEQVQCCANVVPRLFLLCCIGGVYIISKEAPAKDILKDLIEVIKGVQHPMRGLFLRNCLTLVSKNKLPDFGSPFEGIVGNIQDARIASRSTASGCGCRRRAPTRTSRRERRNAWIASSWAPISCVEGLDVADYKTNVLPKILEKVLSYKDAT